MKKPPCKDCPKRHRACHDTCPDYIEWSTLRQEQITQMRKQEGIETKIMQIDHITKVLRNKR